MEKAKREAAWGPKKPVPVDQEADSDDEWVETKESGQNRAPVKKADDPAELIEINARLFTVQEFYLDKMILNFKQQPGLALSKQDKDLLAEATVGE